MKGKLILIDKDINWTSFDVVSKIRNFIKKKFDLKKIKVGHTGTLDPLATGLLIICYGKMTKEIDSFIGLDKSYSGKIKFYFRHLIYPGKYLANLNTWRVLTLPFPVCTSIFSRRSTDKKRSRIGYGLSHLATSKILSCGLP